jgi:hypothetical protein
MCRELGVSSNDAIAAVHPLPHACLIYAAIFRCPEAYTFPTGAPGLIAVDAHTCPVDLGGSPAFTTKLLPHILVALRVPGLQRVFLKFIASISF